MAFLIIEDLDQYPDFEHDFERNLFNEIKHLKSRANDSWIYFLQIDKQKIQARTVFQLENHKAINPYRSTFGGIEYSENIGSETLNSFIQFIIKSLQKKGVSSISMILPPHFYGRKSISILEKTLTDNGFSQQYQDLNQHLVINDSTFESNIFDSEKRRLKKCLKANFEFKLLDKSYLEEYFELLVKSRTRKGYPLTLDKNSVEKLLANFSTEFQLCGVFDQDILIAASILVKVNSRILYYFLPADHADYLTYSPIVLLLSNVYQYCQTNHLLFFDLGTSSSKGKFPHGFGLANFKENCGAIASPKRAFAINC